MEDNLLTKSDEKRQFTIAGIHINDTGIELVIGDMIYYIIGQILILIFTNEKLYNSIGYAYGVMLSVMMVIHMSISIEQAMCFNEKGADKHVKKTAVIRLVVCGIALIIFAALASKCIVGMLFGIMALKVSAYIQPLTHKVLARKSKRKGR